MSVIVLDQNDYFRIGKSLKLKFDFINRLYKANQKAYDLSYNLIQEIEDLDISLYDNFDFLELDRTKLNLKLRSIRYNIYPNDSDPIIDNTDLIKLDQLVCMTNKKVKSEDLI